MTAYRLYLLFIASYFLHLPARIPALGVIRFDLLLAAIITLLILFQSKEGEDGKKQSPNPVVKYLWALIIYIIITLPLVKWPGSVINKNAELFIKAIVFFFFTVSLVDTRDKLKLVIQLFLGVQIFRVLEPLYLHVTQGYWGSFASMANWEYMNRLSGAPNDIINPNGLAFVIVTVIPLLHFLLVRASTRLRLLYFVLLPLLLYALILTGSRSGFVGLLVIVFALMMKSKRRFTFIALTVIVAIGAFSVMNENEKDRFESTYDTNTKNAGTAEGRIEGWKMNFQTAMERPLFGHGLGTSAEANFNSRGEAKPAHNLYLEILEELGLCGEIIFLLYMKSIFRNFGDAKKLLTAHSEETEFLSRLVEGMQVWLFMNVVFSLASYGLSSYEWYLFGGISVVVHRLAAREGVVVTPVKKHIAANATYR